MMMSAGGFEPSFNSAGVKQNFAAFGNFSAHGNTGLITGLHVCWNDAIVGIELFFDHKSAGLVKGTLPSGTWEENFTLTNGDFIVQIFGRHSNVINCFGIKTAKGFTKVWGNPLQGNPFTFGLNGQYIKAINYGVNEFVTYMEPVFGDIDLVYAKKVAFCPNGKTSEPLGKNGVSAEAFDDESWISQMFNYSLAEVKVFHDGKFCYGIQTFYNIDGTKKSPGTHMIFASGIKADSFALQEDEHVTTALIRAGDIIDGITLYTDKGRKFTAGGQGGNTYLVNAPQGMQIVAFRGTLGDQLSRLQVYCDEIY